MGQFCVPWHKVEGVMEKRLAAQQKYTTMVDAKIAIDSTKGGHIRKIDWKRCVGYVYTRDHLPRAFLCDRAVIACEWNVECLGGFEGCGERRTEPVLVEGSGGCIPELTIKGGIYSDLITE
ncbi:hypothetical protein NDU88_004890 [Pleurodeles waltl]|uniref:Uncharacterized protein n=1 Tax=Pleurodeles waltl TaxID=8319 RepID=A0AAV7W6I2_PLEWA|nr:hypothetical protein NDU88_004890 [Pleurodeles waltl]